MASNSVIQTNLRSLISTVKSNIGNFDKNLQIQSLNEVTARQINHPLGLDIQVVQTSSAVYKYFYQYTGNEITFDWNIFAKYWTTDQTLSSASEDIFVGFPEILSTVMLKSILDSSDPAAANSYYEKFLNPYINFILSTLLVDSSLTVRPNILSTPGVSNDTVIKNNLFHFIKAIRGAGTVDICTRCTNLWGDQPYRYLSIRPSISRFCGCCYQLMEQAPDYYAGVPQAEIPTIECQPQCNKDLTILQAYQGTSVVNTGVSGNLEPNLNKNFEEKACVGQTVCVIAAPTIKMYGGNNKVFFNQQCQGCQQGKCACYIDTSEGNIDLLSDGKDGFQNSVTFNSYCNISYCTKKVIDIDGSSNYISVPCNSINPSDTNKDVSINYDHSGKIDPNSTDESRNRFIFSIQSWSPNIYFLVILILIIVAVLSLDIKEIPVYLAKGY